MTDHTARHTLVLDCSCLAFLRKGDAFGRAARRTEQGERLVIVRRCPLHGPTLVRAIVHNHRGGWLRIGHLPL